MEGAQGFVARVADNERQATYEHTDLTMSPLTGATDLKEIVRVDLPCVEKNRGFALYNVLSPSECKYYIEQSEALGLEPITYRKDYRNNDRVVANSHEVAALIWDRIKGFMDEIEITKEKDSVKWQVGNGFRLEGKWRPLGLNECWRLCRYRPGGHFGPHFDGYFIRNSNQRSMKTFMLYLNSDFEGGTTNFLANTQGLFKDESGIFCAQAENILHKIKPEPGMALVFNHMILHEGERVQSGLKYIMRSDILYERVEGTQRVVTPQEEEALRLYQEAETLECDGRQMEAAALYRKAFRLCPELETASMG